MVQALVVLNSFKEFSHGPCGELSFMPGDDTLAVLILCFEDYLHQKMRVDR